jgi:hypothetical protein
MKKKNPPFKPPADWIEIAPGDFAHPQSETLRKARARFGPILEAIKKEKDLENKAGDRLPDAKPKRHKGAKPMGEGAGEKARSERAIVRFTLRRAKPLDRDNATGSVKDLTDGLRYAGLIHDDTEAAIDLRVEQEPVRHHRDEKTVIEIEYPEHS